ncbi:MAG TPA: FixH family protein [Verrucomicrobiae bacterium]
MKTENVKRNPWPYAIIAWFVIFITAMTAWAVVATRNNMDLVRKDYYEEELRHQQQIDRVNRTAQLRQDITVTTDTTSLTFKLPTEHATGKPTGEVQLYRPSDASLDKKLTLAVNESGLQRIDASELKGGLWKLRVSWRLGEAEYYFDQSVVLVGKL